LLQSLHYQNYSI